MVKWQEWLILLLLGGMTSILWHEAEYALRDAGNLSLKPWVRNDATRKAKICRTVAWISAVLTIWLTVGATLLKYIPRPTEAEIAAQTAEIATRDARTLMTLPKEATVVKVEFGDWGGDGEVYFTLPKNRPVSDWLNTLWKINPPAIKIDGWKSPDSSPHIDFSENEIDGFLGGAFQSVKFDKDSGLYIFSINLER